MGNKIELRGGDGLEYHSDLHYRDCLLWLLLKMSSATASASATAATAVPAEYEPPVRRYPQWVFMKRNADLDYDAPPTVVASTCNVEEAIDIMVEAEFDAYDVEKAEILRAMKVSELFMVTEDIAVWRTESVRRRLIIWDHRQHYDRRMDNDNFMEVWAAFRKYMDYIENCYDNDFCLSAEERVLLHHHVPYQDLVFAEEYGDGLVMAADGLVMAADDGGGGVASSAAPVWNGAHTRSLGELPVGNIRKRSASAWMQDDVGSSADADTEELMLSHYLKQARITPATLAEDSMQKVEDDDDDL